MSSLFSYHTLSISLHRETKNCEISIENDQSFCPITFSNELENFFDWLSNKVEIASVILRPKYDNFSLWNEELVKKMDASALHHYFKTIQRISWTQLALPQTVIWKLHEKIDFLALEITSGADIKIAKPSVSVKLNYLENGLTPSCGGCVLLNKTTNQSKLKSYMMTGLTLFQDELIDLGLVNIIDHGNETQKIIKNISNQSPVARMQLKRSFNNDLLERIDDFMTNELSFANATLSTGDWERKASGKDFVNPRDLSR